MSYLCSRKSLSRLSDSSAVGSVPRSGRGGREFESPLSDQRVQPWIAQIPHIGLQ